MVTLNFPFNSSVSKSMNTSTGAPSRINVVDQVTYIYLGSVANQNSVSKLSWKIATSAMIITASLTLF